MGKDRSGRYHPPKGKPSDTSKEGLGLRPGMDPEDLEQDMKMTERYTEGPDKLASDVYMRHPNRQTRKGKEVYKPQEEGSSKTYKEEMFNKDRVDTPLEEIEGVITKDLLKELYAFRAPHCITLILPTHRSGMEVNEQVDNIAFKNMLQDLILQLQEKQMTPPEIEKLLEPGFELLREDPFWRNLTEGLIVFIAEGFFKYIKLPYTPAQEMLVSDAFYLLNLLPLLNENDNAREVFWLLVIRRDKTTLYKADAYGMREETAPELPENITAVMAFPNGDQETITDESGVNAPTAEVITAGRPEKKIVDLYVRKIDEVLQKIITGSNAWPLVLAGQMDLLQAFRRVSQYSNTIEATFEMEEEYIDSRKLYTLARQTIHELLEQKRREKLEAYYNNTTTGLTTSIPADVIAAAHYSQIRTLFVRKGTHIWGTFDEVNSIADIHDTRQENDDCLVERAAVQTILRGGEVFILDDEQMPKEAVLAALLRFSM